MILYCPITAPLLCEWSIYTSVLSRVFDVIFIHTVFCTPSVFYSTVSTERFETTYSTELTKATGGPASGEGLQSLLGDDDELEADEELSGLDNEGFIPFGTLTLSILTLTLS